MMQDKVGLLSGLGDLFGDFGQDDYYPTEDTSTEGYYATTTYYPSTDYGPEPQSLAWAYTDQMAIGTPSGTTSPWTPGVSGGTSGVDWNAILKSISGAIPSVVSAITGKPATTTAGTVTSPITGQVYTTAQLAAMTAAQKAALGLSTTTTAGLSLSSLTSLLPYAAIGGVAYLLFFRKKGGKSKRRG